MRLRYIRAFALLFFLVNPFFYINADSPEGVASLLDKELKADLGHGSWLRFSFVSQFWARYTELNEGTVTQAGDPIGSDIDFAMRRTRFTVQASFQDRVILYTQLGFNNMSSSSPKPEIYLHDVWTMFRIIPDSWYVGFGLHGWAGLSRLSNVSSQRPLTLDNPGFNYPAINRTDIDNRQTGMFMKGTAGRVSYRVAINKPFVYDGRPDGVPDTDVAYEYPSKELSYKGYFALHLWDKEYFNTSYLGMTTLGEKKLFNIGAGFDYFPESMAWYDDAGNINRENQLHFAADLFMELPMAGRQSLSLYSVLYKYDFGKNYLRTSGTVNVWNKSNNPSEIAPEGFGNGEFRVGTGTVWYNEAGYLFPENFLNVPGRIQLFYAASDKNFEALNTSMWKHDMGGHYYAAGQKLKFTVQYSLRPMLNNALSEVKTHKSSVILQVQAAL